MASDGKLSIPFDLKVFPLKRILQHVHTGNELKNEFKNEIKNEIKNESKRGMSVRSESHTGYLAVNTLTWLSFPSHSDPIHFVSFPFIPTPFPIFITAYSYMETLEWYSYCASPKCSRFNIDG